MEQGTVKWFNDAKGFGFCISRQNGEDVFVHYSAIEIPNGFQEPSRGSGCSVQRSQRDPRAGRHPTVQPL